MLLRGIVIRKTEAGEHNKIITVYTRELGKIKLMAKSAKKSTSKQAGHLDLLNLVDFVAVPGKSYQIITQTQSSENFLGIKSSYAKLMAGFFVLESFHRLIYEEERDPALWNFLNAQLNKLEEIKVEPLADQGSTLIPGFLADFKKELINVLGYKHNLEKEEADYFLQSLSRQKFSSLHLLNMNNGELL